MLTETLSENFRKVRQTNSTDASFPSRVPVLAVVPSTNLSDNQPAGEGGAAAQTTSAVFELAPTSSFPGRGASPGADVVQNNVIIVFFGTGADNNTFKARLIGWRLALDRAKDQRIDTAVWVPVTLCEFLLTLCAAAPGVAGSVVDSTQMFADTLAISGTAGNDDVSIDIVSPADNASVAHVVADLKGFRKLEVTFDRNGSATSCNGLISLY